MLFDSHAHINYERYSDAEREELISDIEASPVDYVIDVGFDVPSSELAVVHAKRLSWCYVAVGVHPHYTEHMTDADLQAVRKLAAKPKVIAIGEIGLDYYKNYSPREDQRTWFRRQIELAIELSMPIIVHDRESEGDTMSILKEERAFEKTRVLLHCFSGDVDDAKAAIELGCMISIAGPVTYKNAEKTREVARIIPIENLLIETDAPYLSPMPFRGKQNSSPRIVHTAKKIAEIRGMNVSELEDITGANAMRFFGIE